MKLTIFKNRKGMIHGSDPKRISCDTKGLLKIGQALIDLTRGDEQIMPMLFNGADGDFEATFVAEDGSVYAIEKVAVRGGRISPPPPPAVEIMELRCRADAAEEECAELRKRIHDLENIFDTNSLNFLI